MKEREFDPPSPFFQLNLGIVGGNVLPYPLSPGQAYFSYKLRLVPPWDSG